VCCRSGSIGIKDKNLRNLAGKPILYWLARELKKTNLFDKIVLSTDSKKIAKLGSQLGFHIPGLRPKYLSTGQSNVFDTHKFVFKKMDLNDDNSIVCIVNNNPFIKSEMIKKTYKKFIQFNKKFIVHLAHEIDSDQIFYRQCKNKKGILKYLFKNELIKSKINRNQIEKIYINLGEIRWAKINYLSSFKKYKDNLAEKGNKFILIDRKRYIDLNTIDDFNNAKNLFRP
jgi:CMP-N,N'-diacetyllegionaminic acid synthase